MSASEDSEANENLETPPNFTSYQPAQIQSFAAPLDRSSDPRQSDHDSKLLPGIDNDHNSDDSFLPSSDDSHHPDAEGSHDHDNLDERVDPFEAEESYYTRPNRYHGPASTWRSWTKDEREVAESLDLERAQDLSIHLYNAHALRKQTQKLRGSSSRKRRRGTSETDGEEDEIFGVPKVWSAWPMPPHEVPRKHLGTVAIDTRPSKELEDCLISMTMKAAREQWNAREWQEGDNLRQQTSIKHGDQQGGTAAKLPDHEEALGVQISGSQAFADDESSQDDSDDASAEDGHGIDPNAKPVPLADDEKARRLLLPSTRHVISKLDHLLMALHRARQSYASPIFMDEDDRAAGSTTDAEGHSSTSSKKRRRRSLAQRASSVSTVGTDASASISTSRRRKGVWKEGSVPRNRKLQGLGLRDWSDVLGMAALTGWDEDTVVRASKRCAVLFGEDMLFRRFYEAEHGEERSFFTERLASGKEPLESGEADAGGTPRTQTTDKHEDSQIEWETASKYPCPIESCPRHKTPFHTTGNLKQHMIHNHAQSEERDDKDRIGEATVRGGRQILCPVQTCHRSREPFMKGSKLYLHVRKMHPEVNVEDLKKLESQRRGETRGKWKGEKRKRNPYERG
jgi:hypothetical protein